MRQQISLFNKPKDRADGSYKGLNNSFNDELKQWHTEETKKASMKEEEKYMENVKRASRSEIKQKRSGKQEEMQLEYQRLMQPEQERQMENQDDAETIQTDEPTEIFGKFRIHKDVMVGFEEGHVVRSENNGINK